MATTMPPGRAARTPRRAQAGMTLVELMVALVIGLIITAAAVAALIAARSGFGSVDSTTQMRENARFTADLIHRLIVQGGFQDVAGGFMAAPKVMALEGYDDSLIAAAGGVLPGGLASGTRSSGCGGVTDTSCMNGSDVLVIRFYGISRNGVADGSMINCAGVGEPERPGVPPPPATSIFHVVRSAAGEPTLACTYQDPIDDSWKTEPLVPGVEALQVLYGVDAVVPNTAPTGVEDSVPDRYLRATELVVAGNAGATAANWSRVRSVRIGLLFRSPATDAIDRAAVAATYNVLGDGLSVSADTLSQLTVPADGRMRQAMVFHVHLRNP